MTATLWAISNSANPGKCCTNLLGSPPPWLCGQCAEVATDAFVRSVDHTRHVCNTASGAVRLLGKEAWDGILKASAP